MIIIQYISTLFVPVINDINIDNDNNKNAYE